MRCGAAGGRAGPSRAAGKRCGHGRGAGGKAALRPRPRDLLSAGPSSGPSPRSRRPSGTARPGPRSAAPRRGEAESFVVPGPHCLPGAERRGAHLRQGGKFGRGERAGDGTERTPACVRRNGGTAPRSASPSHFPFIFLFSFFLFFNIHFRFFFFFIFQFLIFFPFFSF